MITCIWKWQCYEVDVIKLLYYNSAYLCYFEVENRLLQPKMVELDGLPMYPMLFDTMHPTFIMLRSSSVMIGNDNR